jgi:hypothetical protein
MKSPGQVCRSLLGWTDAGAVTLGVLVGLYGSTCAGAPANVDSESIHAASKVAFDEGKRHPYGGLGLQVWRSSEPDAALEKLFGSLHVRHVRVELGAGASADALGGATTVQGIREALANGVAPKSALWLKDDAASLALYKRMGINDVHMISWEMPVGWRIQKDQAHRFANPERLQAYANLLAAELLEIQGAGYLPGFIELDNEPNGAWNTKFSPEDYARLVDLARTTFDKNGLRSVGIEGPGTGNIGIAPNFIEALNASGASADLAAVSLHAWDQHPAFAPVGLDDLLTALGPQLAAKKIFITEFNENGSRWSDAPYECGPKVRCAGNQAADSADYAVAAAAGVLRLLNSGAYSVFIWQAEDKSWGPQSFGLLRLDGQPRPEVAALSCIPPAPEGVNILPGHDDSGAIVATGFATKEGIMVAAANLSGDTVKADFALGIAGDLRIQDYCSFPPAKVANSLQLTGGRLELNVILPAKSVSAFTIGK